jgi:8-oxo-dGTP pyrophosphatase MutT (NUDIX family)
MRQPMQVSVYIAKAAHGDWQYLLLRRTVNRGGFWQGVTGGVEGSEGILEAVERELTEETGLSPLAIHGIDCSYSFPVEDRWRHLYAEGVKEITEYVFVAHVDGQQDPILDPGEHDQWEWCSLNRALELLTWPENKEALQRCASFLRDTRAGSEMNSSGEA